MIERKCPLSRLVLQGGFFIGIRGDEKWTHCKIVRKLLSGC